MIALLALIAIVGAEIHPVDGPVIPVGTVVIDGTRIIAVGADVVPPADAEIIDGRGKVVTPGLIDAWTQLGLIEVRTVARSNDTKSGLRRWVRAGRRAVDAYNPASAVIPVQRAHGVTTVLTTPSAGLVSGRAAIFDLVPSAPVKVVAAMRLNLGGRAAGGRDEALAAFRELVNDTRLYARSRESYDRGMFRASSGHRLDLEAMIPVVEGRVPLVVQIQRASDIENFLKLARILRLRIILVDAAEAWKVADKIAAAKVPVIVNPWMNVPTDFDRMHARDDDAKILTAAGVNVILSSMDTHNVRKLRQWAGNAVRSGLSHDEALRAVTINPARTFELNGYGALKVGNVANVVVWSGDPFELSTRAEHVIIRGEEVDLMHRQRALFERYRDPKSMQ